MRELDRRIIYVFMIAAVAIPLILGKSIKPAPNASADRAYTLLENLELKERQVAMLWLDYGPNSKAENQPQTDVILEHLFRKRIKVILLSQYQQAEAFLTTLPKKVAERMNKLYPDQKWEYGTDWINAGYRPGASVYIQGLAKAEDISTHLKKDALGMPINQYPAFKALGGIENVGLLIQLTSLVGTFDNFIQYFHKDGYKPTFVHGCTSITIPEAYIFLDSGQLQGLLEGLAGAAWYSVLLKNAHPERGVDEALLNNTALAVAHLVILALILAGNLVYLSKKRRQVR